MKLLHSYLDRPLRDGKDADECKPNCATEATANIENWYQAGRPLFPRETLQSIVDQLRSPLNNGDMILVEAFDGLTYQYPVRAGDIQEFFESDEENEEPKRVKQVMGAPHIHYRSFEGLKRDLEWSLSGAYCSVRIAHWVEPVNPTPESLDGFDAGLEFTNTVLRDWEGSEVWKAIKSTLLSFALNTKIRKIVGMECGSFTSDIKSRGSRRSAVQHALLLSLKQALEENRPRGNEVTCYAQDPAYSQVDQLVLERLGITVVEDPEGFLEIDDTTLLVSCAPNICVKEIVADIAQPPIIIWDIIRAEDPEYPSTDPNSARVHEMAETCYDQFPFPENHGDSFSPMTIMVKKQAQASQEQ